MTQVIVPETRGYTRVFSINIYKQKGACFLCRNIINLGEVIVSNSYTNTKYYHESCARKVMILSD